MACRVFVRVPDIDEIDVLRVFRDDFFKGANFDAPLFNALLYRSRSCGCATGVLLPFRKTGRKELDIFIAEFDRPTGGIVTQLSGVAAAIKNQHGIRVPGQFAL